MDSPTPPQPSVVLLMGAMALQKLSALAAPLGTARMLEVFFFPLYAKAAENDLRPAGFHATGLITEENRVEEDKG